MDEPASQPPLLEATGVVAGYGATRVIRGVNLTLRRGEILALLGANGAGKSTLLKALTGQLPPFAGSVRIAGIDIAARPERAKAEFGLAVNLDEVPLPLTGRQYLELVASIRGCAANAWPESEDVLGLLALGSWIDRPIATYSLGTRMKTAISAALLGAPPLLIFDESLNGLDPVTAYAMKQLLSRLAATGRHGILLCTHIVETVPSLCTDAVFLAGGEIVRRWDKTALADACNLPGGFEAVVIDALGEQAAA